MNSEKERRYLFGEKDLPIVLVHGTMGKSEDWSRVVEELSNSRSVIRLRSNQIASSQARCGARRSIEYWLASPDENAAIGISFR